MRDLKAPLLKHKGGPAHSQSVHRSNFGRGTVVVPNFISLVGGAATQPIGSLDTIDVVIRDDPNAPKYWSRKVQDLVKKLFAQDKTGKKLNLILDPYGPHDGYSVPMMDLVLRPSDGSVQLTKAAGIASALASIVADFGSDDFQNDLVTVPFLPITKSEDEKRYTFSVVYKASSPQELHPDAHREIATADELQRSQWGYVRKSIQNQSNNIFVQHGVTALGFKRAGEWVDIVNWPYSYEATFRTPEGYVRKSVIPAGSTHMGVVWDPWCWDGLVKTGKLRGFSFGGRAKRFNFA